VRTNDIAGVGDGNSASRTNAVGDPTSGANGQFSAGSGNDQNFYFSTPRRSPRRRRGTSATRRAMLLRNPCEQQWDIALFKNVRVANTQKIQFRAEIFNFLNHPNWSNIAGSTTSNGWTTVDPTNANFGRVTSKNDARREVQLSLRYIF